MKISKEQVELIEKYYQFIDNINSENIEFNKKLAEGFINGFIDLEQYEDLKLNEIQ